MEKIKQTIENTVYGYNPQEFMPIFEEGQLANRSAFIAYKLRRATTLLVKG